MPLFTGTAGADQSLIGSEFDDQMYGFDGNDRLVGREGADFLHGGNGDDQLWGGAGGDVMFGGAGSDLFSILDPADSDAIGGIDLLLDFETGVDLLQISGLQPYTNVSILRDGASSLVFARTAAGQTVTVLSPGRDVNARDLVFSAVMGVSLLGSSGTNTLIGGSGKDVLYGFDGADRLEGGADTDLLYGGLGGDTLLGGQGADMFGYAGVLDSGPGGFDNLADFQTGVDKIDLRLLTLTSLSIQREADGTSIVYAGTADGLLTLLVATAVNIGDFLMSTSSVAAFLSASESADLIAGTAGADVLFGLGGADVIVTGAGNDALYGGNGDDVLQGDLGADVLFGGAGADRFTFATLADSAAAGGFDVIADFQGGPDRIDLRALALTQVTILWDESGGSQILASNAGGSMLVGVQARVGLEHLLTSSPRINLEGTNTADVITGTAERNQLVGRGGDDVLHGLGGDDLLAGDQGADNMFGGDGNDTIWGGDGDDIIQGGAGNDTLDGQAGRDAYFWSDYEGGARSVDAIAFLSDDRILFGMLDIVYLSLTQTSNGTLIDLIGQGGNTLYLNLTGNGSYNIQASAFIFVGRTPVTSLLIDQRGNGSLVGSALDEILVGGAGLDALTGGGGRDTFRYDSVNDSAVGVLADNIMDFVSGQDLLDLRALGSNIVVDLATIGTTLRVLIDVNLDGVHDMLINLRNVSALTPNDFLFTGRFGSQPAAALPEPEAAPVMDDGGSMLGPDAGWLQPSHGDWFLAA